MRSFLILAAALVGCVDATPPSEGTSRVEVLEIDARTLPPADLLVVLDNSAGMLTYEERIAIDRPQIAGLLQQQWRSHDIRIGVITSDVGCDSSWRVDDALATPFLQLERGPDFVFRSNVAEGNTSFDVFGRLLAAGHEGCGARRPFDTILAALEDPTFRRAGAELVVWVISSGDDESTSSPAILVDAFTRLTAEGTRVDYYAAAPVGVERLAMVTIPNRSALLDLRGGIADLASSFSTLPQRYSDTCISGAILDADGDVDCVVADRVRDRQGVITYEQLLPRCDGSTVPCWKLTPEPSCARNGERAYVGLVDRAVFPPLGTRARFECAIPQNPE